MQIMVKNDFKSKGSIYKEREFLMKKYGKENIGKFGWEYLKFLFYIRKNQKLKA